MFDVLLYESNEWEEAENYCKNNLGHLASVHQYGLLDFVEGKRNFFTFSGR